MTTSTYTPQRAFPRSNLLRYPIDRITEEEIGRIREREGIHGKHQALMSPSTYHKNRAAQLSYGPLPA